MIAARAPQPARVAGDGDAAPEHGEGQRAARARPPPRLATTTHRHEHCSVAGECNNVIDIKYKQYV